MSSDQTSIKSQVRRGSLAGVACYLLWGVLPLYWKTLAQVDALEILAQRIIWCFVFTALVCFCIKADFWKLLKDRRALSFLFPAAILITVNWGTYIYAVTINRIVETAIGYYINPLVVIFLGMIVFKERLSVMQWIAIVLCCIGVIFFTVNYGQFPWISLVLALSFGCYSALKKKGGYPAIQTIAVESALMLPFALAFSVVFAILTGASSFLSDTTTVEGWKITALLVGGGAVTAIPLILFADAANSIPLTLLGFLQYLSPTISLTIGVFVFGEPFTVAHAVCLGSIWTGLALVGIDSVRASRLAAKHDLPTPVEEEESREIPNS